jgi:hypothetical protein
MAKNKVEILALLDRSGSMYSIIHEAVAAFNTFIEAQKALDTNDKVKVTLACFDDRYELVFDRVDLHNLPELTVAMVQPRGMTGLNDAIGKLVNGAKYPSRDTVLLVQTDGYENASQEYTAKQIKELIEAKETAGWDVNFIGAGIDAFSVSKGLGFSQLKSLSIDANAEGMQAYGASIAATTTMYRNAKQVVV